MDQQRIILESSPLYVILCAVLAAGLAYLLYKPKHPWPKIWNQGLFVARFILTFILLFLLLGPIVKQVSNYFEKPLFVIVRDNSASIKQVMDSTTLKSFEGKLKETEDALIDKGFEVKTVDLGGNELTNLNFNANATDLHYALKEISQQYEGKNISGVIFPTDGIFTTGLSPLYDQYNFPIYSIGIGDTTERTDAGIKNIGFNRIAYQGNKFPVRVEVQLKNLQNENIEVTISRKGKQLDKLVKKSGTDQWLTFDFTPLADEQGIQKLDILVTEKSGERNVRNNHASIFVEVVEGKKKILLVASSPHPDIKPIREVISQNSNYEFILYIPGIEEDALKTINPEKIDLVIFHQSPDLRGKSIPVFQQFMKGKSSLLFIIGQQTDLRTIAQNGLPLRFDSPPREFDQVTPVINSAFNNFILSPETISIIQDYPPVSVHFGRIRIPPTALPLLLQKVGNLSTQKPLLALENQQGRKIGLMLGEGLWRWRLNEFDRTEKTLGFDELFGKLIQYLSTTDDKRKFKSYPIQQDFSDTEPVVFESQVYNDIFEPIYGNKIDIEITDEKGQKKNYNYITSSGNIRYQIGGLKEGVYKYKSRTTIQGANEEVRGEFAVVAKQAELQNLTADFDLLRKLASNTGGKFYTANTTDNLKAELLAKETKNIIHSEETFESLVNLKWVFWLLVVFVGMEWLARKYFGSY
jgi:hypothetical protein